MHSTDSRMSWTENVLQAIVRRITKHYNNKKSIFVYEKWGTKPWEPKIWGPLTSCTNATVWLNTIFQIQKALTPAASDPALPMPYISH